MALALSSSEIDLSWTDNSSDEQEFRIERSSGSAYAEIGIVGANVVIFSDTGLSAGISYTYRIAAYNAGGHSPYSNTSSATTAEGSILREYWTGISGTSVTALTGDMNYPDNPNGSNEPTSFEAPTDWADDYGTRMRGYLHVPVTGSYEFWIASDDSSELWLNTSGSSPGGASIIAYIDGWTNSREWTKYGSQHATGITLQAGQKYYIEALQKEGSGGDNLAVSWQGPGITQEVIPGDYLSPWTDSPPTEVPAAPTSLVATAVNSSLISLTWTDNADNESGFSIERKAGVAAFAEVGTVSTDMEIYNDAGLTPETTYTYRIRGYNVVGYSSYSNEASNTTPVSTGGWLESHIGGCDPSGAYTDNAGTWTLTGIGEGISPSDATDQTYFIYKEVTGDIEIICRNVNSGGGTAGRQCGVCIRDSLDTGARQISAMHSNNMSWVYGSYRTVMDGNNTWADAGMNTNPNIWLKVSRTGDTCSMYYSSDGADWTQFGGNQTITFTGNIYVGVFASSESSTTTTTSDFQYDNITTNP